jgi:hypothetical protein
MGVVDVEVEVGQIDVACQVKFETYSMDGICLEAVTCEAYHDDEVIALNQKSQVYAEVHANNPEGVGSTGNATDVHEID